MKQMLDVSDLGILSEAIEETGLSPDGKQAILRCVGEKNLHGATEIFDTENIPEEKRLPLRALMSTYGSPDDVFQKLKQLLPEQKWQTQLDRFARILSLLSNRDVSVDFSVVNDMSYYNGIVFKGFISGIHQSILSGGQYDLLLQKAGRKESAIGFAVYMDLLEELSAPRSRYDVDVLLLYDDTTDPATLSSVASELRASGKSVDTQRSIPEKLKYRKLISMKRGDAQ